MFIELISFHRFFTLTTVNLDLLEEGLSEFVGVLFENALSAHRTFIVVFLGI